VLFSSIRGVPQVSFLTSLVPAVSSRMGRPPFDYFRLARDTTRIRTTPSSVVSAIAC
jgi:hypothetical protein